MSLTSPITTLTLGQKHQCRIGLPQHRIHLATTDSQRMFLRRDFRQRADYTANPSFNPDPTMTTRLSTPFVRLTVGPVIHSPKMLPSLSQPA